MQTYTQHEISAFWPNLPDDAFRALVADIVANGQHNEIWLYDGQVLDGWQRARACAELGIPLKTREYTGTDPIGFVDSMNDHRRHETPTVRATCKARGADWRSRGRIIVTGNDYSKTTAELAKSADVSVATMGNVKAALKSGFGDLMRDGKIEAKPAAELARKAPDLVAEVVAGVRDIPSARAELKEREAKVKRELPTPPAPDLNAELDRMDAQIMDMRAELIELRAASHDEQLRAQARDEIAGLREALALEQRLHAALKAQASAQDDRLNDWKRRCASLERQLDRRERGE